MKSVVPEHGAVLSRIQLGGGWFGRLLGRSQWLCVAEQGLVVESPEEPSFVPWDEVQSVRQGRAQDAFVVVHSGGRRLIVPAEAAGSQADALAQTIASCAGLEWIQVDQGSVPPMAIRAEAVAAYQRAFRTWSRLD